MDKKRRDLGFRVDAMHKTKEGFLELFGTFAATGELTYYSGDTAYVEHVTDEVLNDSAFLNSIVGKPFTLEHPFDGLVTPDNFSSEAIIGNVGSDVRFVKEGEVGKVVGKVNLQRRDAIDMVERGEYKALSMAYYVETELKSDGKIYQTKRECNHLSLVKNPRCKDAKLHLDSWEQPESTDDKLCYAKEDKIKDANMTTKTKDNSPIKENESCASNVDSADIEMLKANNSNLLHQVEVLTERCDSLAAQVKQTTSELTEALVRSDATEQKMEETIKERVKDQVALIAKVSPYIEINADSTENLKQVFVEKTLGISLDSASEEKLDGMFEACYALRTQSEKQDKFEQNKATVNERKDSSNEVSPKAALQSKLADATANAFLSTFN